MNINELQKILHQQLTKTQLAPPPRTIEVQIVSPIDLSELEIFINKLNKFLTKNDFGICDIWEIDKNQESGTVYLNIKRFDLHQNIIKQLIEFSKGFMFLDPLIIKESVQENGKYFWKWHEYGDDWYIDPDEKFIPIEMQESYNYKAEKDKIRYLIWAVVALILSMIKVLKVYYSNR